MSALSREYRYLPGFGATFDPVYRKVSEELANSHGGCSGQSDLWRSCPFLLVADLDAACRDKRFVVV